MDFLVDIAIDYFGWLIGKRSKDEQSMGSKRKAYILFSVFIILVVAMGVYSLVWIFGFFNK